MSEVDIPGQNTIICTPYLSVQDTKMAEKQEKSSKEGLQTKEAYAKKFKQYVAKPEVRELYSSMKVIATGLDVQEPQKQ